MNFLWKSNNANKFSLSCRFRVRVGLGNRAYCLVRIIEVYWKFPQFTETQTHTVLLYKWTVLTWSINIRQQGNFSIVSPPSATCSPFKWICHSSLFVTCQTGGFSWGNSIILMTSKIVSGWIKIFSANYQNVWKDKPSWNGIVMAFIISCHCCIKLWKMQSI